MAKDEDEDALTHYKELAIQTYKWMENVGAVYDEEKHTRRTVTVDDWAKNFAIYLKADGEPSQNSYQEWAHVKLEMIGLGYAIAISPTGHYLGQEGEQATNIIYNIIHSLARIRRATLQLEKVKESGKYEAVRKQLRGKINPSKMMGLIEASKGVSALGYYQFEASGDLLLLVADTEEKGKDKL
jgi:hypothetical protein